MNVAHHGGPFARGWATWGILVVALGVGAAGCADGRPGDESAGAADGGAVGDGEDDGGVEGDVLVLDTPSLDCPSVPFMSLPSTAMDGSGIGFDDVTEAVGLPPMYGEVAAWGDANGDGTPDLYVPAHRRGESWSSWETGDPWTFGSELYLNCGGAFVAVGLRDRTSGGGRRAPRYAAAVADLDGDGLADLITGGQGVIDVAWQGADGRFSSASVWELPGSDSGEANMIRSLVVADLDGDGRRDIYAARYPGDNPLLINRGDRTFANRATEFEALRAAGESETYSASLIGSRTTAGRYWLYLANHDRDDRVFRLGPGLELEEMPGRPPWPTSTMGVDFTYLDDRRGLVVVTTDTARFPIYGWSDAHLIDYSERLTPDGVYNQWGVLFADLDNDGAEDLVYAPGIPDMEPDFLASWGESTTANHAIILRAVSGEEARWDDVSAAAGDAFAPNPPRDLYAVAAADFDRDGCIDLVVTPLDKYFIRTDGHRMTAPIRLLRNRCTYSAHWLGLRVFDDPGALAVFHLSGKEGTIVRRYRALKAAAGNGSAGDFAALHVGLGGVSQVDRVEVRCRDGRTWDLDGSALDVDAWNDRPEICAPSTLPGSPQ